MAQITVVSEWKATHVIEIPDNKASSVVMEIISGGLPEIIADQITSANAELINWEVQDND